MKIVTRLHKKINVEFNIIRTSHDNVWSRDVSDVILGEQKKNDYLPHSDVVVRELVLGLSISM